jgi:hypothetical protein
MAGQELVAESDPLIEEGPVYEGVGLAIFDYLEFWDLEGLQTWVVEQPIKRALLCQLSYAPHR